jgi:hypothetical protein
MHANFGMFALLCLSLSGASAWCAPLRAEKSLFDGKSTEGWEMVGPGRFVIQDGLLKTEGGMGLLWYTKETFGDCVIRVVYKTTNPSDNSGVFIRIDGAPKDPWHAVHHGFEVQIDDGGDDWHRSGAIYSMSKAMAKPGKLNEWNTMEITLRGEEIAVDLNGVPVTRFNPSKDEIPPRTKPYEPERGPRPTKGYIGLQNHHAGSDVLFREVTVRPLP